MWKNNTGFKYRLLTMMVIFLSVAYYFFKTDSLRASTIITTGDFTFTAENKWNAEGKNSYASLNWEKINDLSQSGYQLFQMNESNTDWTKQSINYGKQIKVLNVYPNISGSRTLKGWMDSLNLKDKYGSNLIQVTEVPISSFNTSASNLLKDSKGDYLYDVIMFGSWDSNNGVDISTAAYNEVKTFSDSGRGVLFGHDTIYEKTNFQKFAAPLGIVKDSSDRRFGGRSVKVVNNGYLLKYPFELKNDVILTIPETHAGYKVDQSIATVWMKFVAPFTLWPTLQYNSGNYTNEWYLITKNNLAMIQTGHSNGTSTLDERKIIANTLYNLAQVSIENSADDFTVKDDKAPKLATVKQKTTDDPSNITLDIDSVDQGKDYIWYITGTTKSNGVKKSDTVKETITSNIAGYRYVLDSYYTSKLKEETEQMKDEYGRIDYSKYDMSVAPTGTTDKQSASYDAKKDASLTTYDTKASISNINAFTDLDKFLHIVSVDRANNVSEVKTVKIRDLLTKFYVTEKYKDVDGNELSKDTLSIVNKNENYDQSFKSIPGYVAESYQIEGQEKLLTNKAKTVAIEKVATNYTVTYYYKKIIQFNFRQVMLSQKEDIIMPNSGYLNVTQKTTTETFGKMNVEVQSGLDGEATPYNSVAILKDPGDIQVLVDVSIPMYYKYAGYDISTKNNEHLSQERVPDKVAIKIDPSSLSYWLTVYLEPSIDQNTFSTPYSWGYKKNEFGTIGIE